LRHHFAKAPSSSFNTPAIVANSGGAHWPSAVPADLGYKAALVKIPSFFKSQFSNPVTQMLYFRTMAELSNHPNIAGIKESSGNVEKMIQMVCETKKGFQVLTGSATTLAPSLAVGCTGGILAFADLRG
jgi:hypothetical protein